MTTRTLTDTSRGRWLVRTASSTYRLDLDARTGVRHPGSDAAALRRDGESWEIVEVAVCRIGMPMVLMIRGLASGGTPTLRSTTEVLSIERSS